MEIRQIRNSDRPTEARGMNHGLAAVIALTLALAAALQAGFSRLATQSAIAAVISVGEGRERAARVAQVQGQIAVQARKNPARGFYQNSADEGYADKRRFAGALSSESRKPERLARNFDGRTTSADRKVCKALDGEDFV